MKIVVNSGRTVHVATKPGIVHANGTSVRPEVKRHGPTNLIDLPDEDAKLLVARGFARKYEPPKAAEGDGEDPAKKGAR